MAKRTKTSKAWMHEHVTDPFVKAAKRDGYRSRAAFKLLEIDKRDGLFAPRVDAGGGETHEIRISEQRHHRIDIFLFEWAQDKSRCLQGRHDG